MSIKNLLIAVLTVALCTTLLYACEQNKQLKTVTKENAHTASIAGVVQPARVYKDSAGATHIVLKTGDHTYSSYSQAEHSAEKLVPFIDSVAQALSIKPKQLESILVVPQQTEAAKIAFLQRKVDSLSQLSYYFKDKYLELAVKGGNPLDSSDKGTFDFKYNADLSIMQYWKRRKVLGIGIGARQSYTDISSKDPRTSIMGVRKYTVAQRQPGWGLRIQATQNYSFISNTANTGIGARFDLKHMSIYGAYYYNWKMGEWRPVVSASYDLLRF